MFQILLLYLQRITVHLFRYCYLNSTLSLYLLFRIFIGIIDYHTVHIICLNIISHITSSIWNCFSQSSIKVLSQSSIKSYGNYLNVPLSIQLMLFCDGSNFRRGVQFKKTLRNVDSWFRLRSRITVSRDRRSGKS